MIPIDDRFTIGDSFARAAQAYAEHAFLAVPATRSVPTTRGGWN